jgi:hypothetical protein
VGTGARCAWVERVDDNVHLNKPCQDVQDEWQAPGQAGEYPADKK